MIYRSLEGVEVSVEVVGDLEMMQRNNLEIITILIMGVI